MEKHHGVWFRECFRALLTSQPGLVRIPAPDLAEVVCSIGRERTFDRPDGIAFVPEPVDLGLLDVVVIRFLPWESPCLFRVRIEEVEGEEVDTGGVAGTDLDEVCEAISGGLASLETTYSFLHHQYSQARVRQGSTASFDTASSGTHGLP